MNILITGATGFIGNALATSLKSEYNTYLLVRETSDVSRIDNNIDTVIVYKDYCQLLSIFEEYKFNGVIHFASQVRVDHSIEHISDLLHDNILFGTYLLEASKNTNVEWFINTGTFWQHYNNQDYNPVNLYAATKEAFEDIAKYYTQSSKLIFTTIKLNDTFGLNDSRVKILSLWLKMSKNSESIDMTKGEQIVDISYIDDVVKAYAVMVKNLIEDDAIKYNNKSFVVTNKEKPTLLKLSNMFEEISGKRLFINWGAKKYREREVMKPYSLGVPVPNWEQKYTLKESIKLFIGDSND